MDSELLFKAWYIGLRSSVDSFLYSGALTFHFYFTISLYGVSFLAFLLIVSLLYAFVFCQCIYFQLSHSFTVFVDFIVCDVGLLCLFSWF